MTNEELDARIAVHKRRFKKAAGIGFLILVLWGLGFKAWSVIDPASYQLLVTGPPEVPDPGTSITPRSRTRGLALLVAPFPEPHSRPVWEARSWRELVVEALDRRYTDTEVVYGFEHVNAFGAKLSYEIACHITTQGAKVTKVYTDDPVQVMGIHRQR